MISRSAGGLPQEQGLHGFFLSEIWFLPSRRLKDEHACRRLPGVGLSSRNQMVR